jgi:hypothetical protein
MILEGLVVTVASNGAPHLAPMGSWVPSEKFDRFLLRPFVETKTFVHLRAHPYGTFHVTDDILLIARAVTGQPPEVEFLPASRIRGFVLRAACRAYEFEVVEVDCPDGRRACLDCRVLCAHRLRDFLGFNRARHALLELAIHATRLWLVEPAVVRAELERARVLVQKTGGSREEQAYQVLRDFIEAYYVQGNR